MRSMRVRSVWLSAMIKHRVALKRSKLVHSWLFSISFILPLTLIGLMLSIAFLTACNQNQLKGQSIEQVHQICDHCVQGCCAQKEYNNDLKSIGSMCTDTADCNQGLICIGGRCSNCLSDQDCGDGAVCNVNSGLCEHH